MTVYGASDPQVIGQPISPFFGAQQNTRYVGAPTIPLPNASGSGPVKSIIEQCGTGSVPVNAYVNTINGVAVGGPVTAIGGDPSSVLELIASGNGNQANGGVGFGVVAGEVGENQEYLVNQTLAANLANGPTPVNVDPIGLAPVPGGLPASSVVLVAQGFGG